MEVKPGYKKTEVGVIPEDWKVDAIGDAFDISGGVSASWDQLSSNGHCYLHYGNIHKSTKSFIDVSSEYLDIPKLDVPLSRVPSKSILADGDVVFVDASEDDEGTSKHLVVVNPEAIPYISGLHTIVAKSKTSSFDNAYKRYCFQTSDLRRQFYFFAVGTKVSGISKTNIKKVFIPRPPLPEQRAIAEALGDVDALLGALEKLIAKKRDLKQAAMQQLLTGQTRLPGFSGEWEVKRLGDVAHINMGQSPDSRYYNRAGQGLPLVQGNADIENRRSILRAWTTQVTKNCDRDDLLLTVRAPVGAVGRASLPSCIGRGVCSLKPNGIDQQFLFHALVFAEPSWKILEQGSTFTAANSGQVAAFSLSIPPSVPEQTAIASVLSDMDAELAALDQRLAKTRALKQGMMQELLTGRVRLV